ncbi:MAG: hypothetical protein Q9220_000238 [cf. Caloplaca sp. 1 TL-2023]
MGNIHFLFSPAASLNHSIKLDVLQADMKGICRLYRVYLLNTPPSGRSRITNVPGSSYTSSSQKADPISIIRRDGRFYTPLGIAFTNGSSAGSYSDGLVSDDLPGNGSGQERNGYQFRGSDPESDDEDADGLLRRYRAQQNGAFSVPPNIGNDDHRAGVVKYTKVSMPVSVPSSQESVDGYDSFENTNNKKKRKIPISGSLGGHHSSLSAEMAHMGISSGRDFDVSLQGADEGIGQYYGTGSSAMPAAVSGTGISGAGRGRYGRVAARIAGSTSLNSADQGIISAAIANAATLPPAALKGKENMSLLEQHASKRPASSKTQFTFTCDSDSARSMAWQEQVAVDPANSAYNMMPPLKPPSAQPNHQGRLSTQGTQTSPNIANGSNPEVLPQVPANPDAQPQIKKPHRSLAKQLAIAARQRRLQQEYDKYHHPPNPEDSWICEFCEYEMIFGSPPKALIRQYEIKDRRERRHLAEKRRLLEKAKMKGRKSKKGSKNAARNSQTANPGQQAATKQRYDQPPDDMPSQTQDTHDEYYTEETYEDDPPPPGIPPPRHTSTRIPQPVAHGQHQSLRSAMNTTDTASNVGDGVIAVEEVDVPTLGLVRTQESSSPSAKLRVDNLHYDLTEDDLEVISFHTQTQGLEAENQQDLFTRIGPITSLSLRFDRAGRSSGTAFVAYEHISDARLAIREFDGANAHGQPIRLTLLPGAPAADSRGRVSAAVGRNPFDTAERPTKSLFDRIDDPRFGSGSRGRGGRSRSRSPGKPRRSDVSKPAPEGVDRYVPPPRANGSRARSRSPPTRRDGGRGRGRERRGGGGGGGDGGRRDTGGARPRKTQEELDKEMEDYWGPTAGQHGSGGAAVGVGVQNGVSGVTTAPSAVVVDDEDVDMGVE